MIFKKRLQSKFTAISNAICEDKGLSTEARWCLWYLLTKPSHWYVRIADIKNISGWGKEKTYKVVKELVNARYLVAVEVRDEGGQFGGTRYDVYEEPFTDEPLPENRDADIRDAENRDYSKDLKGAKTEVIAKTEKNISAQSEFDEFWAAYPKRPNNPRKKAMAAYVKARKNVSQKQLLEAVGLYAAYMTGEDPKFIAMASTWLNDERWNCDYSKTAKVIQSYNDVKYSSDDEIDAIIAKYPGVVSDRAAAKKALASELSKGVALDDIVKAAEKFKLYIKQMQQSGVPITAPILEAWVKFKWREMDAYYIYRNPVERYPVLKPVKVK